MIASILHRRALVIAIGLGATAIQAASRATSTIPVVMVFSGDPVKAGVALSLNKPGRNVTGTSSINQELSGKRLEPLKEMAPGVRSLAVLLYPGSEAETRSLQIYEAAARALGLEVHPVEIRSAGEIGTAVAAIARMKVQAVASVGSSLLTANSRQIVEAVARLRLPASQPRG